MAQRYDRGRLSRVDATPQGGLRVDANLTRVGVLTYTYADGRTVRELRHPDEIFRADSLATLAGAPLVVGHPAMVNPANYREHAVGHVGDNVRADGKFVTATVRVQEAGAIKRVQSTGADALREISCGYTCDVKPESGVYNGETFDAVQRNVRYNHAGMGPVNWGRAGNDVALKLDAGAGGAGQEPDTACEAEHLDGGAEGSSQSYHSSSMTPEQIAALQAQLAAALAECAQLKADAKARTDAAGELATLTGANKALTAQVASLTAEVAAQTKRADEALAPAALDKATAERVDVCTKAKAIVGERFDATGKTIPAIMREAIEAAYPGVKFDGDGEVKGAFLAAAAKKADVKDARKLGLDKKPPVEGERTDGADEDPIAKARAAQRAQPAVAPAKK